MNDEDDMIRVTVELVPPIEGDDRPVQVALFENNEHGWLLAHEELERIRSFLSES